MESNYTEKIEAFINQQMSAEEKAAFKAAYKSDPVLEEALKLKILERETVQLLSEQSWRANIKQWNTDINGQAHQTNSPAIVPPVKTSKVRSLRGILSIAASILLLVSLGLGWWINANFSNTGLISGQYLSAAIAGDKGGSNTFDTQYEQGVTAFTKTDYATTVQLLESLPIDNPNYIAAQYYLGHSYYLQKQYTAAIPAFQSVLAQNALPAFINRDKLKWNLALAYVANKQTNSNELNQLLQELSTQGVAPYNQKAKDLKNDLNSFWRTMFW